MLNRTGLEALGANATEATNVGGQYLALPEYLHQMHCLDIIRKSFFQEDYKEFALFQEPEAHIWGHIGEFQTPSSSQVFYSCWYLLTCFRSLY
jgi:hypothetical protein